MKRLAKNAISQLSGLIPFSLYPKLVRRNFLSFFYHAVSDDEMEHVRNLYPIVSESAFIYALDFLKNNYTFITYEQLHEHIFAGKPIPFNAVHLSFDDGLNECYSVVRPILLKEGIPCTFFLTIDWLDNREMFYRHLISLCVHLVQNLPAIESQELFTRLNNRFNISLTDIIEFKKWISDIRDPDDVSISEVSRFLAIDAQSYLNNRKPYLTRDQVVQMRAEGFSIGAHGITHRKLGFVPDHDVEREIVGSCQAIHEITGQDIVPFSFPQSAGNVDRNQLSDILTRHPNVGVLFDTKDLREDESFIVNRIWAERTITEDRNLHTLPDILRYAYQKEWVDGAFSLFRGLS